MKTKKIIVTVAITVVTWILVIAVLTGGFKRWGTPKDNENTPETITSGPAETSAAEQTEPIAEDPADPSDATEPSATAPTEPPHQWETGYIAALTLEATYCDEEGTPLGTLPRGTQVEYENASDGSLAILLDDEIVYLQEADIVSDPADVIPDHTLYVRTALNLRDSEGKLLAAFADKGAAVEVAGYDYLCENGAAHMYRVRFGEGEGYIMPWYLADNEEDALANYDDGNYATHSARGDSYGGGDAATLDYYPREKGVIDGNEMPEECRTLYIASWCLNNVDTYLQIADNSGINAFVVDIVDGGAVGYASDVMNRECPSGAASAQCTVQEYQAAIRKLKDAGYYVIGRITTFNDSNYVKDHPEYAIASTEGEPLKLSGEYWPTAFSREAWQYKVDLAVEAVELMGFHEIQFDYVRFPDSTWRYENAGTIDFRNTYGETKAQAIQRFLMYATDILHEHGVYVSADVYGESAFEYVTAYGQYWAGISNVVDVISGMPYPDHFGASGSWLPWEHPYETLYNWGQSVMLRQGETATPAVVRTWIQAYNAIHKPYNTYGPEEVSAQVSALRDAGCTGGYMTWNAVSSIDKYTQLMPAFAPRDEE